MNKEKCVEVFNKQLNDFINDLITVYPKDDDLYTFKTSIKMLSLVDDKKVLRMFKEFVYDKYKEPLMAKDSEFFLQNDYNEFVNGNFDAQANPEVTEQLINKIKSYWKEMSTANRDIVWSYLQVLIKLTDKFIGF